MQVKHGSAKVCIHGRAVRPGVCDGAEACLPRTVDLSAVRGSATFWNYHDVCKILGARYPTAPLSLITVAALLPPSWDVRLLDRNTEELTQADLDWADIVMTGGMMAQKADTLDIIRICREQGKPVVVGGRDATWSPHLYTEPDFQVRAKPKV